MAHFKTIIIIYSLLLVLMSLVIIKLTYDRYSYFEEMRRNCIYDNGYPVDIVKNNKLYAIRCLYY